MICSSLRISKTICFAEPVVSNFRTDKSKRNQNIGYQITATMVIKSKHLLSNYSDRKFNRVKAIVGWQNQTWQFQFVPYIGICKTSILQIHQHPIYNGNFHILPDSANSNLNSPTTSIITFKLPFILNMWKRKTWILKLSLEMFLKMRLQRQIWQTHERASCRLLEGWSILWKLDFFRQPYFALPCNKCYEIFYISAAWYFWISGNEKKG